MEAAPPERKHPTSSNRKKKMDLNNPQPKRKRAKQANESGVQPGETRMEHGATSSFVWDKDGLTLGAASRDGTEISCTPTHGVGSEDNAVDIEGAYSPSTLSDAEDEMATSFPGGPTTLELLSSFCHHVLLDVWRNKSRGFLKCINHGSRVLVWRTIQLHPEKEWVKKLIASSGL
ncbi:hypothetical protein Syun_001865 [Stephania yunnanensis]|uniref:Uncharacterized protein n=1 Tax=Stephania yunnanensis TaxID=152371 RepID=A0AAP0LHL2_9MAGN